MWYASKGRGIRLDSMHSPLGGRIRENVGNAKHYAKKQNMAYMNEAVVQLCLNCRREECPGRCVKVMEIEREHSNKNYSFRKNAKKYLWQGEMRTARELAMMAGMQTATLQERIRNGMSLEEAMTRPVRGKKRKEGMDGEFQKPDR